MVGVELGLLAAADIDPAVAELLAEASSNRLLGATAFIRHLASLDGMAADMTEQNAADLCWALTDDGHLYGCWSLSAAGIPIEAKEQVEETFLLFRRLVGHGKLFMLRVKGDSMTGAAITDRDLVVVRQQQTAENGEIVAAQLDRNGTAEATVKALQRINGHVWLMPHNPAYQPILSSAPPVDLLATRLTRQVLLPEDFARHVSANPDKCSTNAVIFEKVQP